MLDALSRPCRAPCARPAQLPQLHSAVKRDRSPADNAAPNQAPAPPGAALPIYRSQALPHRRSPARSAPHSRRAARQAPKPVVRSSGSSLGTSNRHSAAPPKIGRSRALVVGSETIALNERGRALRNLLVIRGCDILWELPLQKAPQELYTQSRSVSTLF